jgi:SAM-dependent methyltransferase
MTNCPICKAASAYELTKDGCAYFECSACDFLFHRPTGIENLRNYDRSYWESERTEALRREREDGFMRAVELLYLSAIPVENILDFGCGFGVTVTQLREELKVNAVGVDPFGEFEESAFLHRMTLRELRAKYPQGFFDAIYSIEVFEHLESPKEMLTELFYFLKPGGKLLINTGTREFLAKYDPAANYIDPLGRGHISIYSLKSFSALGSPLGFTARFLGERTYMVLLESREASESFPTADNLTTLARLGSWVPPLFREYMRLILLEKEFEQRTAWALSLDRQLMELKEGNPQSGSNS